MFDVSWGETFIITGLAFTLIGRKDLPKASHFLGRKIGQVVGLLQGARARADKFATNNELNALQNELRSGLRELDTVKGELAIAASSRGLIGRGLMSGVGRGEGRIQTGTGTGIQTGIVTSGRPSHINATATATATKNSGISNQEIPSISGSEYLAAAREASEANVSSSSMSEVNKPMEQLAPRTQSVAAVAEEEWGKQGIGFTSRAEMGTGQYWGQQASSSNNGSLNMSGSFVLSDIIQQGLIHDQYDRAVGEQDDILRSKVEKSEHNARRRRQKGQEQSENDNADKNK